MASPSTHKRKRHENSSSGASALLEADESQARASLSAPELAAASPSSSSSSASASVSSQKRSRLEEDSSSTSNTSSAPASAYPINPPPTDRPVRVYCDGIYDMFHFGHARSLQQAKSLFPNTYLLVGVCSDELTHRLKGKTVMSDVERYESVRHCRWVDEVVEAAPWVVTDEFLKAHQIDYVAHGEDAVVDAEGNDLYQFVKETGRFCTIKRTEGVSTSGLIERIIRNYDAYVLRNLNRGCSRTDLNVSFVKANKIRMDAKINEYKANLNDKLGEWKDRVTENVQRVWRSEFTRWFESPSSPPHP